MKTKTKSIFISFIAFVLSFCASPYSCVCPQEKSQEIFRTVSSIVNAVSALSTIDGDVCWDCGHKKNCCFSNQEQPAVLATASIPVSIDYIAPMWSGPVYCLSQYLFKELLGGVGNRAPPWLVKATLQDLHQQLLV